MLFGESDVNFYFGWIMVATLFGWIMGATLFGNYLIGIRFISVFNFAR